MSRFAMTKSSVPGMRGNVRVRLVVKSHVVERCDVESRTDIQSMIGLRHRGGGLSISAQPELTGRVNAVISVPLLKNKGLLSDERIKLILSFRNSGFSVDTSPTVWPQDLQGLERISRYLLRCPVSLSRIHWTPGSKTLFYESKSSHDDPLFSHPKGETLDILEFIARVLTQIPEPRVHGVRYSGAYSSKARAYRKKRKLCLESSNISNTPTPKDDEGKELLGTVELLEARRHGLAMARVIRCNGRSESGDVAGSKVRVGLAHDGHISPFDIFVSLIYPA